MTTYEFYKIYNREITSKIRKALEEDTVNNDITSKLVISNPKKKIRTELLCKEDCVLAGLAIFKRVFLEVSGKTSFKEYYKEGDKVYRNAVIARIAGLPN